MGIGGKQSSGELCGEEAKAVWLETCEFRGWESINSEGMGDSVVALISVDSMESE